MLAPGDLAHEAGGNTEKITLTIGNHDDDNGQVSIALTDGGVTDLFTINKDGSVVFNNLSASFSAGKHAVNVASVHHDHEVAGADPLHHGHLLG